MAKVTNYIDVDRLGEIFINNPKLNKFTDIEPMEGMILKGTNDEETLYFKIIINGDGEFEAYEVDEYGKKLGEPFLLDEAQ